MLIAAHHSMIRSKPYLCELEYLESTGTQYIDTDEKIYDDTAVTVTMYSDYSTENATYFFGSDSSTERFYFREYQGKASYSTGGWWQNTSISIVGTHTVTMTNNSVTVDGVSSSRAGNSKTGAGKLLLLTAGTYGMTASGVRIYSCKIWQNGILVRDMIPVRDLRGKPCMYDRVSGKLFYNAGTGSFTAGPEIHPVEYIESTGTEYIDTGFIPGLNFHIEVRGRKAGDYSVNAAIFSNEGVNSYVDCYYNAGWGMRCYGNGMARQIYDGWFDAGIDFDFTSSPTTTFHMNSEEETATTSKTEAQITGSTKSVRLFQGMYGKTNPVDIVFFNADKSGQPALRLIAVRVGTDATSWEGAMMDTLTRRVYRNDGTGAFTYGNDTSWPTA